MECPNTRASSQNSSRRPSFSSLDAATTTEPGSSSSTPAACSYCGGGPRSPPPPLPAGRKTTTAGPTLLPAPYVHELLAFVAWLLGVSLVALVHVERRQFPRAARVGAAAANAVVDFVPPVN